jgi:hypothetical protein
MSILKNSLGAVVPVRERREASGNIAALNGEVILDLNGDANALVYVLSDLFVGTLEFTGASDTGPSLYFPIQAYAYSTGCTGGTIPLAGQPMLLDALVAANLTRVYSIPVAQLRRLRIRASAYTSGNCTIYITADTNHSLNPVAGDQDPATLAVTATGAAGAAVTLTLPSVAGLRHYIDSLHIVRSATAALTASATPVVVTTTNLPGTPAFTFGSDVAGIGVDKDMRLDCGPEGLAASVLGTNTTVVCPVYTGVIWRINCVYHLGT